MRFILILTLFVPLPGLASVMPFINEFHYDNSGIDEGEGVEIAGLAGTVLDGWSLLFYNGSSGMVYATTALAGVIADQQNGFGTLFFATGALQNGAPDGMALVDAGNVVQQFLSYEGVFTATEGAAAGLSSVDTGVGESSATAIGWSLQLTGAGSSYADFTWIAAPNTYSETNSAQQFAVVPLPASLPLLLMGLVALLAKRRTHINECG